MFTDLANSSPCPYKAEFVVEMMSKNKKVFSSTKDLCEEKCELRMKK